MQINADMMFSVMDYPAQGIFESLQVVFHFEMNEKLPASPGKMHNRLIHFISLFWDHKSLVCNQET